MHLPTSSITLGGITPRPKQENDLNYLTIMPKKGVTKADLYQQIEELQQKTEGS